MATWIVHLRMAEKFLDYLDIKDSRAFLTGSIGPDCGDKVEGKYAFDPPSKVTHFIKDVYKDSIDTEGFYETYLKDKPLDDFYLGYYIHLLCDVHWSREISKPAIDKYASEFKKNSNYMDVIKQDWYGLDFLFLEEHPTWPILEEFREIGAFPNHYFDFYKEDAFTKQIQGIYCFYNNPENKPEYLGLFLSKDEMEDWIHGTYKTILEDLKSKNIGEAYEL